MKSKKRNYFRIALQWLVVVLLGYMVIRPLVDPQYAANFESYCPFGGLQAISSYLVSNTLACSMTSMQMAIGLALILCIIFFSKLFCSYICPIGTFTEWLGKFGEKLKVRFTVKGFADRVLRIFKYALLFLTFYITIGASELFCRKYDPYFAVFNGFGGDTVLLYALIALAVVILGSFFIRQAWCKYLCPLGAATNIFANFILFAVLIGIYLLLTLVFKIYISWVWLLAAIVGLSYLKEAFMLRAEIFPLLKVTRNPDTCTLCRKCDKVCPMAIKVSESGWVNHIDCHLCGDCVVECPEKDVLRINRRNIRWVPPVAVILLTVAAFWFASVTEIPTINERWGTPQQLENAKVYEQSGIKNVKCYGSSMAFAEQMKEVKGVLGVETFIGSHTVKVYYDPSQITEEAVKKAIFTPSSVLLNMPAAKQMSVMDVKIENYFDTFDEYYLEQLLSANPSVYGFSTSYGEPVSAKIYFDQAKLTTSKIIEIIQTPEITIKKKKGDVVQELNFKADYSGNKAATISTKEFYESMIKPMDDKFNKFENYKAAEFSVYEIPVSPLNQETIDQLSYLESHLSNDAGVVAFKTVFTDDNVFADITFVTTKTKPSAIYKLLNSPKFTIYYNDGTSEEVDNAFKFDKEGKVLEK